MQQTKLITNIIRKQLLLQCPNYSRENDEQVTLEMLTRYRFINEYLKGAYGYDPYITDMTMQYMSFLFPQRTVTYPAWIPNHLLIEPRLLWDDENTTLYRNMPIIDA